MSEVLNLVQAQWPYALALVVGFPALLMALNEWAFALARAGHPVAASVRFVRTWVAPLIASLALPALGPSPAGNEPVGPVCRNRFLGLRHHRDHWRRE